MTKDERIAELEREVERIKSTEAETHFKKISNDTRIDNLKNEVAKYNEYFKCFACESFEEFQKFIGTFMLTPHEEQTYIRELENKVKQLRHEICEKIRNAGECSTEWIYDLKSEKIVGYFVSAQLLDQIERGEE